MNRIIYQIAQMQLGKGVPIFFFLLLLKQQKQYLKSEAQFLKTMTHRTSDQGRPLLRHFKISTLLQNNCLTHFLVSKTFFYRFQELMFKKFSKVSLCIFICDYQKEKNIKRLSGPLNLAWQGLLEQKQRMKQKI